ncbi:putative quinate O-hydroxycinnamoyltransferase [Dioscorea sansibarensis]
MGMLKVVSSSLVKPEAETGKNQSSSIWLPTLDLFQLRKHLPTIYFYRPNGDQGFFSPETLRRALGKALVPFYPLAGRLCYTGYGGRLELRCSGEGVLFVQAESGLTLDELGGFDPSPEKRKLFIPTVGSGDHDVTDIPLVLLQVTTFKCGSVCLGVGIHHTVSDGVSSLHFINTWSDIARGLDIAIPPYLDRTHVRARSPPTVEFDHPEFKPNPPALPNSVKKPISASILKLSCSNLNKIKSYCNTKLKYTTYEILAAHVWRCACKARRLVPNETTRAFFTIDGRTRLRPHLPPGYIGNVIFPAVVTAVSGEVLSENLEEVAARFHDTISRLDDKYFRSAIDWLELQEDVTKIGRWVGEFPGTDMSIVSWTRLPIYSADFGWGPPAYMGPAMLLYGGLCYIMPAANKADGIMVAVSLEEEYMEDFEKLFFDF